MRLHRNLRLDLLSLTKLRLHASYHFYDCALYGFGDLTAKAFALINADLGAEKEVIDEIKRIAQVVDVHVCYGVYDLVVKIEADSLDDVKNVVMNKLRAIENVRSTLTMIAK